VLERVGSFATFLAQAVDADVEFDRLRRAETTGRPLGSEAWVRRLERDLARPLAPRKRGRKPAEAAEPAHQDLLSKLSPK
jgi:putative transposase